MKIPSASVIRDGRELKLVPASPGEDARVSIAEISGKGQMGVNIAAADMRMLLDTLGWLLGYPLTQSLSDALFRLGPWIEPVEPVAQDPGQVQRERERSLIELRVTHVLTLFEGGLIGTELDDDAKEFLVKTLRFIVAGGV